MEHRASDDALALALGRRPPEPPSSRAYAIRAVDALADVPTCHCPHSKLRCVVFALEALGDADAEADAGTDVTADVLLPRAAKCLLDARLPAIHAELAFVERFARDDFLGIEGYALTTLRCALTILLESSPASEEAPPRLGEARAAVATVVDDLIQTAAAAGTSGS